MIYLKYILLIVLLMGLPFAGYWYGQKTFEPQVIIKEVPVIEYRESIKSNISDETIMSDYEALVYIDEMIYSHQYYIDRPELQTDKTGDTEFNISKIRQYERLKKLIKGRGE